MLTSGLNGPEAQALDEAWSPKLAAADDEQLRFNQPLFERVAAVHAGRASAGLDPVQVRLVEKTYEDMVRGGAKLDAAGKAALGAINQELAGLYTGFGNKVLADEDTWIVLDGKADLAGLPADLVASYAAAAEERKLPGKWAVVNTRSSVDPFLAASARRDLRQRVWTAFKGRGDHGDGLRFRLRLRAARRQQGREAQDHEQRASHGRGVYSRTAAQVAPQAMPLGVEVTVPWPPPARATTSEWLRANPAVMVTAAVTVTVHGPVPAQPPPIQPTNTEPADGVAVSVTDAPWV